MNGELRARLQLVRWLDGDDAVELSDAELERLAPWMHQQVLAPLAYRRGMTSCRADYAATALLADFSQARLGEVLNAMATRGIDVALLKGIAYARELYADPGERAMADIDLLVRPDQRARANRVMVDLGYKSHAESRFHHATMFQRGNNEVFDIHHAIVSPWRSRIDMDRVWARMSRRDDHLRLDAIDEVLFHFVNMARNALLDPLIHYIDAARLLRRLDAAGRAELDTRARRYRVSRAVSAGSYLTGELLPGEANAPAPTWLPGSWLIDILDGQQLAGLALVKRKLLLADGNRERAGHLVQWLLEQPTRWSGRLRLG